VDPVDSGLDLGTDCAGVIEAASPPGTGDTTAGATEAGFTGSTTAGVGAELDLSGGFAPIALAGLVDGCDVVEMVGPVDGEIGGSDDNVTVAGRVTG